MLGGRRFSHVSVLKLSVAVPTLVLTLVLMFETAPEEPSLVRRLALRHWVRRHMMLLKPEDADYDNFNAVRERTLAHRRAANDKHDGSPCKMGLRAPLKHEKNGGRRARSRGDRSSVIVICDICYCYMHIHMSLLK